MALNISGYTDPGVYIGEVNVPAAISIATVPDVAAFVAVGNRKKRSINEIVQRGQVQEEALTVSGTAPYIATLVNTGDKRISNTTIRRTLGADVIELPNSAFSYSAAYLTGTDAGPYDLTTTNALGLKLDSGQEVTMTFADGVAAVAISGSVIAVTTPFAGGISAATRAEVATGINLGLAAATALGYGTTYSAVATDVTTGIKITSPISTYLSDVQVLATFVNDASAALGFTTPAIAATVIEIASTYYNSSAAYEIDYVAVDTDVDSFVNAATSIIRVGYFAGVRSFQEVTDYELLSGTIDWSVDTAASFTGSITETFNLSTNDTIRLAIDNRSSINIDLNALASPPPGYVNPAVPAAATAAEVVKNINAILAASSVYGPKYKGVASVDTGKIKLTSPSTGLSSSIELSAPAATDATTIIFGLLTTQLPYIVLGTGTKPVVGSQYFVTYEYDRVSNDYNTPKRYYSEDAMVQDLTPVSSSNRLAMLGQIAFDNEAPSIIVSQVNDLTTPGSPSVNEVTAAINGLKSTSVATDVIVDDTRLNTQTYLMSHIENQCSPTEKNYRSGWFGMPTSTAVGDKDTPDSFVYRAAMTLQVGPDSPARGRLFLLAPSGVDRTITNEDGSQTTLTLDSVALCAAVAAKHTSFTSPSVSLASKTIIGFDVNTFPTYQKAERAQLASNGVCVVTNNGGRLELMDPVSTEAGGGKLINFMYRSLSSQKDNVTRSVDKAIDRNLRGLVPDDLYDFIFDIKMVIASVLTSLIDSGAIGKFRDENGFARDIDLSKDIQVEQSKTDPTKFYFRYFFYLRYPALRFFGEFSVDNPFFTR